MAFFRDEGLLNFNPQLEEERRRRQLLLNQHGLPSDGSGTLTIPIGGSSGRGDYNSAIAFENMTPPPTHRGYSANEFVGHQPPPMVAPPRQAPSRMSGPTPGGHHPPAAAAKSGGFKWPGWDIGSDALLEMSEMIAAAEPSPVSPAPNFQTGMSTRPFKPWNAGPPSSALAPTGVRQLKTPISSPAIDSTASARNKKLEDLLYGVS